MKTKTAFLFGTFLVLTSLSRGAISWQAPKSITNSFDVVTSGSFVHGYNFSSMTATVNGVTFSSYNYNPGDRQTSTRQVNDFTFSSLAPSTHIGSGLFTTGETSDGGAYGALRASNDQNFEYSNLFLRALAGQGGSGGTAPNNYNAYTFTLEGLVKGNHYLVQLWYSDGRNNSNSWQGQGYLDVTTLIDYSSATSGVGGLGQHISGTFEAGAASESFSFRVDAGTSTSVALLNAYQLRQIPEPSAVLLSGLGLFGLVMRRRR